ncbi:protein AF-10-like isoform X3 [Leptidea sinapis]|uniref:protein AF-10-like isoform X3 n=1 Tax=Leptidea sinapis TaxID=189913 RepID=UPI002120639C|nr:protein AF-10-like isoform X3 [Leptidea sinapis]
MKEMVGGCCVCSDERGWPDNPLVYCDGNGCNVAVHQACYGIIAVPTGPWFCRKCECPEYKGKVRCELCPSKSGALKRSDTGGWAHVVCALYIPEVRFGNVTSMEPIVLRLIPSERFNKTCYICQDQGKTNRANAGACMQCNKSGCRQQFHVTCAQALGLLCEEAGNYLDNVKYCGYCQHHYSKLKKGGNVKTIPPYKPVSVDSQSSDSSGEKESEPSMATGSGTSTNAKSKGPGRKSSHTSSAPGKAPASSKATGNTPQTQDKKKSSPIRRGSAAGDGSGSKNNTPAPSPQHSADTPGQKGEATKNKASTPAPSPQSTPDPGQDQSKGSGRATPSGTKVTIPLASPSAAPMEAVGVISSVAAATAVTVTTITPPPASTATTSVVQVATPKPAFQESVITNTDAMETKQTKKRKAMTAVNTANAELAAQALAQAQAHNPLPPPTDHNPPLSPWESRSTATSDAQAEMEKVIKKAKMDGPDTIQAPMHFASISQQSAPPAHSGPSVSQPSPRHLHPNPMPGPSGMNQLSNIRSPSHMQMPGPSDLSGTSTLMFHHAQKQAAMEQSVPGHMAGRGTWGGLNVAYELQDPGKPGVSGMSMQSKEPHGSNMGPMAPAALRNKKRAIAAHTATSVVAMTNAPPQHNIQTAPQNLASIRRAPQPTPPPMYHETSFKESPPSSPKFFSGSERHLKSKYDSNCVAPHMLGNELNPESGAAARLQEQLTAELAAHATGSCGSDPLIPPPLINKAASVGGPGSGRSGVSSAQSLDQLLERQWEQGSQFLMEQAQHFDIASLLSCLHQLRTENVRLEEHVGNLLQRRDHLLAVNARLAIPLTAVPSGPPEPARCPREATAQVRPPPPVRAPENLADRPHQLIMREVQPKPPS